MSSTNGTGFSTGPSSNHHYDGGGGAGGGGVGDFYLFDTQSNSNSSPSISHNNTNISSGFQQQHHQQHQNQHLSSAHHQQHLNNSNNNGTTTNNNINSSNNNSNSLYRTTLPHLYQSQSQASQSQQTSASAYQPHTTAGNDIPTAPYTFPPSATGLLSSLHSSQQQQTQPQVSPSHSPYLSYNPYSSSTNGNLNGHGNGNGNGIGTGNPSAFLSQSQGQGHNHQNGYSTPAGSRLSSYSGLKVSPPGPGTGSGLGSGHGQGAGQGQGTGQGSNGDYLAAYELAVANAVAGNLRGQNGAGESAQYAQSPLTLDHFRQYSRQTSPQRHFSLDPRSTLHTAVNTPDISPDRSAASTPGLASGAHGSHAGSTRKAKYTRSRTGCLGCRVKRVKCDEGRPECKRCVNAKRGCVYPALQDLPKATIRALAAKKRQDSGDSTGDDEMSSDRKRARVSGSAGGETSVDHYMNLIDEEGNVKAAYGHQHERAGTNQFNGNGNGNAQNHPSPINTIGFSSAPQSAAPSWAAQNHPTYGTQNDYGRIPPVSVPSYPLSAQGYSNSISSYHLNATPGYYNGGMNQFKQASTQPSGGQDQRMPAHLPHSYQQQSQQSYSTQNGTPMLDHHMKRNGYANGNGHTHNATAISSPDDGIGSVDNGLIAQHRTSDPQYLSDISRLTSPTLKRSALVGGNAYHMREDA